MRSVIVLLRKFAYKTGLIGVYHWIFAWVSAVWYGFPSRELIVIGVTGTNGKTTVSTMIAQLLTDAGFPAGLTTTAEFRLGQKVWLNDKKMTMLGRWQLQKMLRQMVKANCHFAVIETSSEGLKQWRHIGIDYDIAVFTNLTPEHIESHGSFEAYKQAKGRLFTALMQHSPKNIFNPINSNNHLKSKILRTIVTNQDDGYNNYFFSFPADQKITFSLKQVSNLDLKAEGTNFTFEGQDYFLPLPGQFNLSNALAAISVVKSLGLKSEQIKSDLAKFNLMPGRMEFISHEPIGVLVDYAPEPASLEQLYLSLNLFPHQRLIHILGSAGGGRDKSRRPILGAMAGEKADIVIVTNEDPYDENPRLIMEAVAAGAQAKGKILNQNLFIIEDRRCALEQAYALAKPGDLIVSTGKGSEQAICTAQGQKITWDERQVWREIIAKTKD